MALNNDPSVPTGGKLIRKETTPPIVIAQVGLLKYTLEVTTERREWYAYTQTAAEAIVDANDQTGAATGETYTWSCEQTDFVIESFKVIRQAEIKDYSTTF